MVECPECSSDSGTTDKWIGCSLCDSWWHITCVYLNGVNLRNISKITWICKVCLKEYKTSKRVLDEVKNLIEKNSDEIKEVKDEMKGVKDELKVYMGGVREEFAEVRSSLLASADDVAQVDDGLWSEVVKKKNRKKNVLIVKASESDKKATEMREEISTALNGVQISDTRFTSAGNIVMNFDDETLRDDAQQMLANVTTVRTSTVKRIKPKITICNVSTQDVQNKDEIIETLVTRNEYLQSIVDIKSKMEVLFTKPAAGGTVHHIVKCDPEIRGLIRKKGDAVKLKWGIYEVRDRYHALKCYYCQRYGHLEANCTFKTNENLSCFKCAGNHKGKDCDSSEKKCINCVRHKKLNTNHTANERCCQVLINELLRIRDITDHGD